MLKKTYSEASTSSSISTTAPLMQAATAGFTVKKKPNAKGKASAAAGEWGISASSAAVVDGDVGEEKDVPQSMTDAAFLQQCEVTFNAARQLFDHIRDLETIKYYDDAGCVTAIRDLEGRMPTIVKC